MDETVKTQFQAKQAEIERILEALDTLEKTKEWKVLKELLFAPSLDAIERQMKNEALAQTVSIEKLYRLQGEWMWAKQYMDIPQFIKTLKQQLVGIKKKLNE